ncbi:hypothetical protein TVAG_387450 [Trichomonas vaginalis G3]|uniref:Uncharacterized protein n=1 Tax=Trichomonas vaginalis (strain ATCC PRA-98 / G3) TaxID=412133 RepID=A2FT02_TRIV3|nr:hypothetical protein TVAGG3_0768780 [Trichomonas vaginalis G3]EAX91967.1 hypothetical protein TVAG_387450 [Trichomonas vaginalis G3]KAI5513681.1 hypothetical protein TVAGG3_0768780 [Trichomonas vaginalis G3]|eukprot:XP_001304897.1 hypothetical protein [Trichomonas vaginalis G3]
MSSNSYLIDFPNCLINCTLKTTFVCDHPSQYAAIVINLLLMLPYLYIGIKLLRETNAIKRHIALPDLCYCFTFPVTMGLKMLSKYAFYYDQHFNDHDYYNRLSKVWEDLYTFSLALYFACVCKILVVFGTFGAKVLYVISKILQYVFAISTLVRSIIIPIETEIMQKLERYLYGQGYLNTVNYLQVTIFALSIIILGICFVQSNIQNYFPPKLRTPMKISIMSVGIGIFIGTIIDGALDSYYFLQLRYINLSLFKYVGTAILIIHNYIVDIPFLIIVYMLSVQEFSADDSSKPASEMEFDDQLVGV